MLLLPTLLRSTAAAAATTPTAIATGHVQTEAVEAARVQTQAC